MSVEIALYIILAVLAVYFRYGLGLTQACKLMGVALSDSGSKTGFQDALTPPMSSKLGLLSWILIAALLGYLWWESGIASFGIGLGIFIAVSILVGAVIIPKPQSNHFKKKIYVSLANRYADYEKKGDTVRASAAQALLLKIEAEYPDLTKG